MHSFCLSLNNLWRLFGTPWPVLGRTLGHLWLHPATSLQLAGTFIPFGFEEARARTRGASYAIQHDKTGLICDGNNLDEIYSSLNLMIENKKYLEFGKNAKELVAKFDWSFTIEKYKKILN